MKNIFFFLLLAIAGNVFAISPKHQVQPFIDQWGDYYLNCVNPDNPDAFRRINCGKADQMRLALQQEGWCWEGPEKDSPAILREWKACPFTETPKINPLATYIDIWESAKTACSQIPDENTENDAKSRDKACRTRKNAENTLTNKGWCRDRTTDTWGTCPTTNTLIERSNQISQWKLFTEICSGSKDYANRYCEKRDRMEIDLKKAGYCHKPATDASQPGEWEYCGTEEKKTPDESQTTTKIRPGRKNGKKM